MIQTVNMENPTRRISIEEKYQRAFWQVVTALASNVQATHGGSNPFESVDLSSIVIDTIIALAQAMRDNDQEKIAALQAIARSTKTDIAGEPPPPDSVDVEQKTFLLYINKKKRQSFWAAMIWLGNRVLTTRGRLNPFEAVNVSPLIVSTFIELAGHEVPLNEIVASRLSMEGNTLTLSVTPREKRERFWQNLLTIARSKREGTDGSNPFKAVDRSELVIQLIIDRGKAVKEDNQDTELHQASEASLEAQSFNTRTPMLVLYVNDEVRQPFWEAMVTLGNLVLAQSTSGNPFEGVSASALITHEIADCLHLQQKGEPEQVAAGTRSEEHSFNEQPTT